MPYSFRLFADAVSGLVYPSLCLGCDRRLPASDPLPVCATCLRGLPAAPEAAIIGPVRERRGGGAIDRAQALWAYDASGTVQRIQHALKYGGQSRLGEPLGRLMARAWRGRRPDRVVPVPLSRPRLLERGYNQAESLAAGLADRLAVPLDPGALRRSRPTQAQARLSASERWANVSGAFEAQGDLSGQRVLLVDDVLTTGATLTAAAAALHAAGATVDAAVLAYAGG